MATEVAKPAKYISAHRLHLPPEKIGALLSKETVPQVIISRCEFIYSTSRSSRLQAINSGRYIT